MRSATLIAILAAFHAASALAQAFPLAPVADPQLAGVLRGHSVAATANGGIVGFQSALARDEDGMPTAYHKGGVDAGPDPGADHICVGGDVLELSRGRLVSRYGKGGTVGDLVRTGGHAQMCKADYVALRNAGFPTCTPGQLCMRWYGVAVQPRSCGYDRSRDMGCGIPILQRDANGRNLDYYLTTNTLVRSGAPRGSAVQSDYADASAVPFVVLPGGATFPSGMRGGVGDYAIVFSGSRIAFGVVGDSGPPGKIGEASRALLYALGRQSVEAAGAYTVLMPGSSDYRSLPWPLTATAIEVHARAALARTLGAPEDEALASISRCATGSPSGSRPRSGVRKRAR